MKQSTRCEVRESALRKYEAAHKVWMNTSVFTSEGKSAKEAKDKARKEYERTLEPEGLEIPTHPDNPVNVNPSHHCNECGGDHEPSGARSDCIRYWKSVALRNRDMIDWSVSLLCSATPNSKFLNDEKQIEWAKAFGKFFAESQSKDPRLNDWGVAHLLYEWLRESKYRVLQHRHDDSYRAIDEASKDEFNADTLPLLSDLIFNLPKCTFKS